jgi:hypothetical protein
MDILFFAMSQWHVKIVMPPWHTKSGPLSWEKTICCLCITLKAAISKHVVLIIELHLMTAASNEADCRREAMILFLILAFFCAQHSFWYVCFNVKICLVLQIFKWRVIVKNADVLILLLKCVMLLWSTFAPVSCSILNHSKIYILSSLEFTCVA